MKNLKIKFLIVGFVNTVFGYLIGVINLFLFYNLLGAVIVGLINNVIAITFSFFTYKYFVFESHKTHWFIQYLKSLITYSITGLWGVAVLWFSIEFLNFNFYVSQGISIIFSVPFMYIFHKYFTFR